LKGGVERACVGKEDCWCGSGRVLVSNDACNFRVTLPTPYMNACIDKGAKVRIQHVRNRLWREFLITEDQPNPGSISVREPSRVFVYSEVPFGYITQPLKRGLTRHVSSSSWTIKIQSLMKKDGQGKKPRKENHSSILECIEEHLEKGSV
jgi:hypothetical protein